MPCSPDFALAVQQASHAECEPGTTADLLSIVLDRNGRGGCGGGASPAGNDRPIGDGRKVNASDYRYTFRFPDFPLRAKVWYGKDDDRIHERGIRWLERTLGSAVAGSRDDECRNREDCDVEPRNEEEEDKSAGEDCGDGNRKRVEVIVLEGEGHNLMARGGVMVEVFRSLAEECGGRLRQDIDRR